MKPFINFRGLTRISLDKMSIFSLKLSNSFLILLSLFFGLFFVFWLISSANSQVVPTFMSDTFTDTERNLETHISDSGAIWVKHSATSGIAAISDAGRLRPQSNFRTLYYSSALPASPEYIIYADLFVASNVGRTGVAARMDSTADTYYDAAYSYSTLKWAISKRINGVSTTLVSSAQQILTVGSAYSIKFEVTNIAKKLYVKGPADADYVLKASTVDNIILDAGRVGVFLNPGAGGSNTIGYHLDNYSAENLGASGPTSTPTNTPTPTLIPTSTPTGAVTPTPFPTPTPTPTPISGYTVEDTFTDVGGTLLQNHVGEVGATWTKFVNTIGSAKITASNRARGDSTSRTVYTASGQPTSSEYEVYADIYVASNQGDAAVVARANTTTDSYYYAGYLTGSTPKWHISKRVNGSSNYIAGSATTLTVGATYKIKFEVTNIAKKLYVKGPADADYVQKVATIDNSVSLGGKAGVYFNISTTPSDTIGYHIDSFRVVDLPVMTIANLSYGPAAGTANLLDVYMPKASGVFPAVAAIHGGQWKSGKKEDIGDNALALAKSGFVVFALNYRLSPTGGTSHAPDHINDVRLAIEWIKANAATYKVKNGKMGAWGCSAGGHLALMAGTTGQVGINKVDAVVSLSGPTYMRLDPFATNLKSVLDNYIGCSATTCPASHDAESPALQASADDAASFIANSDNEQIALNQAQSMSSALTSVGVPNVLRIIAGTGHCLYGASHSQVLSDGINFLHQYLDN